MEHGSHLAAEPPARAVAEAEAALLDVARDGGQPRVSRQPAGGLDVIFGAHERVNTAIVAFQEPRQNLSSHESRGAGQ